MFKLKWVRNASFAATAALLRLRNLFRLSGDTETIGFSWSVWKETNVVKNTRGASYYCYYYLQALTSGRRLSRFPYANQMKQKPPRHYHLPKTHLSPVIYLPLGPRNLTAPSPYTSAMHLAPRHPTTSRSVTFFRYFFIST